MAMKVAVMVVMVVTAVLAIMVPNVKACGDVTTLASCLPASTTGSMPTAECCNALATYAQGGTAEGEACLCNAVSNPTANSHGAKAEYAILIPQKCNLNYKAGYVCNGMTSILT